MHCHSCSFSRELSIVVQKSELPLPPLSKGCAVPAQVLGSTCDPLVDEEDCRQLADFLYTDYEMIEGSGHDVMLDHKWEEYASRIATFAKSLAR
jgi:pimeloyl-ACP methyl ester carboxylesterase